MNKTEKAKSIIIVIGLGTSGIAAAKYLKAIGNNVVLFEESESSLFQQLAKKLNAEGIKVKLGMPLQWSSFKSYLNQISKVVIGPGIPWDQSTLKKLRSKGITIQSEISIAWGSLKQIPWVGITGTNGKTTVTHMLHHVLSKNLIESEIGGNVGNAASELALTLKRNHTKKTKWLVIELSSYQIESAPEITPQIGIWTTLTPDHLERHGTIDNYYKIKRGLIENSSIRIYNADDKYLSNHREELPHGLWVSTREKKTESQSLSDLWISSNGKIIEKGKELFDSSILQLPGDHNLQNLLLVTAAAREIGLSSKEIADAIISFKGIPHRLEKTFELEGIEIFNDSKATNFDSSETALKATLGPLILIAGGRLKQGYTKSWMEQIEMKAYAIFLFGESRYKLKNIIESYNFQGEIYCYNDLKETVKKSIEIALSKNVKSILFSPACASFDLYKNFEERGDHFKILVKNFLEKHNS
ncbi:UDP-N-acetylmuramoyl-L-alanine--D-glutamate ligase [Prochlorococcus marinus]|uniref:UDP-N-acetylmuramoyl-L-alanine--D-glutamate ligase n=1 Tax=Prochlorococcus marinus TaxID=1219 RepID=UPI0022B40F76|nr:UDP-N-acetylmuramoyl-L-alanine--D-glutamate ligase [Prochlorococcus marinus]